MKFESLAVSHPVPGAKVSSPFGPRVLKGKAQFHSGVDFAVPLGTPVYAMLDGRVFKAGWESNEDHFQGFGLRLWQSATLNGTTYWFHYGHLSKLVKWSGTIKAGELIGYSGNSGHSTGAHLHVQGKNTKTKQFCDLEFSSDEA